MSDKTRRQIHERLEALVKALGPAATAQITLVGGTAPAVYALDAAVKLRPTGDVDVVIAVPTLAAWHRFVGDLEEKRSFRPSREEGAPICRYVHDGLIVDIMPSDNHLGFTNKWYKEAIENRIESDVPGLHVLPPIYFLATKFEAYGGRGKSDPASSHDLEDIILVLRGSSALLDEVEKGTGGVHESVRLSLKRIVERPDALEIFQSHVEGDSPSQEAASRLLMAVRTAVGGQVADQIEERNSKRAHKPRDRGR